MTALLSAWLALAGCPQDEGFCPSGGCIPAEDETAEPQAGDPCGAIDGTGSCDGDLLLYCTDLGLAVTRCADQGRTCGRIEASGLNDCIEVPADDAEDPPAEAHAGRQRPRGLYACR